MNRQSIIRIDPVPRQFSITWMLGSRCNYECMYCPTELHDKTSKHHDLPMLQHTWQQILHRAGHLDLQFKISFTGGEVTTNRFFLPLIEWIKNTTPNVQIFVTSNGSASLNYYRKLAALINGLSLSTHSEFINEKKFFVIAKELNQIMTRPEKSLHVNIMDEHWNHDRNKLYENFCTQHDINHSVNHIDYSKQNRQEVLKQGTYNLETL